MTTTRQEGTGATRSMDWAPPATEELAPLFPSFELLEILGRGGMGVVYKARQKSLDRLVAIKILPPPDDEDLFRSAERFEHEARTMARLTHHGIVAVHDFGQTPDRRFCYFVMEFVDGTDLAKAIHGSGRLPQDNSLAIVSDVCEALAYAHAHGIIHRDIKPANILLDSEGRVKITDFGLAAIIDSSLSSRGSLTRSNVAMGTPDYAAPEVLTPQATADARADLYSLGVTLYHMLTGEVPRGLFKLPSEKANGVDARFDAIVCRAMEPDRAERYQTALDVHSDLEKIRSGEDTCSDAQRSRFGNGKLRRTPLFATMGSIAVAGVAAALLLSADQSNREDSSASVPAAAATGPKEDQPAPAPPPGPGWIDLLDKLDVAEHSLMNRWRIEQGELRTPAGLDSHETIKLPYSELPEEYDLRLQLTRHSGSPAIIVGLRHASGGGASVMFDAWEASEGYSTFVGHAGTGRMASPFQAVPFLDHETMRTILIKVRRDSVTVRLDGKELISEPVQWDELDQEAIAFFPPAVTGGRPILAVGACATDVTFHRIDLRGIPAVESPSREAALDLLSQLDLESDSLKRRWRMEDGELRTPPDNSDHQTIEFALSDPPLDYDLEIELTRHHGVAAVSIPFVRGEGAGFLMIDTMHSGPEPYRAMLGHISGPLEKTSAQSSALFLPVHQRKLIVLQVRKESFTATLDGDLLVRWEADWPKIRQEEPYFLPPALLHGRPIFGLGACATDVTFHRVTLREIR